MRDMSFKLSLKLQPELYDLANGMSLSMFRFSRLASRRKQATSCRLDFADSSSRHGQKRPFSACLNRSLADSPTQQLREEFRPLRQIGSRLWAQISRHGRQPEENSRITRNHLRGCLECENSISGYGDLVPGIDRNYRQAERFVQVKSRIALRRGSESSEMSPEHRRALDRSDLWRRCGSSPYIH